MGWGAAPREGVSSPSPRQAEPVPPADRAGRQRGRAGRAEPVPPAGRARRAEPGGTPEAAGGRSGGTASPAPCKQQRAPLTAPTFRGEAAEGPDQLGEAEVVPAGEPLRLLAAQRGHQGHERVLDELLHRLHALGHRRRRRSRAPETAPPPFSAILRIIPFLAGSCPRLPPGPRSAPAERRHVAPPRPSPSGSARSRRPPRPLM